MSQTWASFRDTLNLSGVITGVHHRMGDCPVLLVPSPPEAAALQPLFLCEDMRGNSGLAVAVIPAHGLPSGHHGGHEILVFPYPVEQDRGQMQCDQGHDDP